VFGLEETGALANSTIPALDWRVGADENVFDLKETRALLKNKIPATSR